nr:immunoglobulin light chain junction region [Macaca mulatta]
CLQSLEFPWTF